MDPFPAGTSLSTFEPELEPCHRRAAAEAKFVCLLLTSRAQSRRAGALKAELVSLMLCGPWSQPKAD